MFETHTSERLPGSDMVTIVDPCASGARLRYFESPSVAATLKLWDSSGLLMFYSAQHSTVPQWNSKGVWCGATTKRNVLTRNSFSLVFKWNFFLSALGGCLKGLERSLCLFVDIL